MKLTTRNYFDPFIDAVFVELVKAGQCPQGVPFNVFGEADRTATF